MRRFVLTGAPGAGKTALLRALECRGVAVVEEAASDVIALAQAQGRPEPWTEASFLDDILSLQRQRELRAAAWPDPVVVFDRSPICTWALAEYLGYAPGDALRKEVARIRDAGVYERRVLFVEPLGWCEPTPARRISFADSVRFGQVHAEVYRRFGYECVPVPAGEIAARAALIAAELGV